MIVRVAIVVYKPVPAVSDCTLITFVPAAVATIATVAVSAAELAIAHVAPEL